MTDEQQPSSAHTRYSHTVKVSQDQTLDTLVLTLASTNQGDSSRNAMVSIAPELGSNLFRFRVGEHELIHTEQALLQSMGFTGNFVLWPFPNRIRDKRYVYQGKDYSLENVPDMNGDTTLVHGLVFNQPWQYTQPVSTAEAASVTTYIDVDPSNPHYAGYPFASRLSVTYMLTGTTLTVTYLVENKSSQTIPFGFALHPYFTAPGDRRKVLVSLPAQEVMESDTLLLPTGRIFDVNQEMYAMYDLREPVPVAYLRLDHVYTKITPPGVSVLDYQELGLQIQMSATDDFTHMVIYTPQPEPFLCIEHQTCSTDAVNLHNQGDRLREAAHLLELEPGGTYSGSIHYAAVFTEPA